MAMIARVALAAICVLAAAGRVRAQDQIEPDRPDVTNGTHIVSVGLLQLEMGGQFTHGGDGSRAFGSPLTARVGLTEWLEARVGTDGLLTQSDGVTQQTSIGNTQLGAKIRLWADPGGVPVLSILPTVNFPTANADKGFGSGDADYTLAVLTGTDIGRHWHADVNYGLGSIGAGNGRAHFTQHLASVSVSDAISDNWNPYAEIYWFSRQDVDGSSVGAIDTGAIYELGSRYAIDGGVQFTAIGSARDVSVFGGVTMIIGDVLGVRGENARERQLQKRAARSARSSSK
jgi:outer membrane putative beta-barrel porin/alpha-amylase